MELVQDIVIGSLGGLAVRQIKKMVMGPSEGPNAAQQLAVAERLERLEALLANNQAQQQQPVLQNNPDDSDRPVREGSMKRRSPLASEAARSDAPKRARYPTVDISSSDDSSSSSSSDDSSCDSSSDSSSSEEEETEPPSENTNGAANPTSQPAPTSDDSSDDSSSNDSSSSSEEEEELPRASTLMAGIIPARLARAPPSSSESSEEDESSDSSDSSSSSESEAGSEAEDGEPAGNMLAHRQEAPTTATQQPVMSTPETNSAPEGSAEKEGADDGPSGEENDHRQEAPATANPLPGLEAPAEERVEESAAPKLPLERADGGEGGGNVGAEVGGFAAVASEPLLQQEGMETEEAGQAHGGMPDVKAAGLACRSSSPLQEGATDSRLKAVPVIKKKGPSIASRVSRWVGSLNPFRKGAANLVISQDKAAEPPRAASPSPPPSPSKHEHPLTEHREPLLDPQPTAQEILPSPSPWAQSPADGELEIPGVGVDAMESAEVGGAVEAATAEHGAAAAVPVVATAMLGAATTENEDTLLGNGQTVDIEEPRMQPAKTPDSAALAQRHFPRLSQMLMERAETGVAEVTATARAAARDRVWPAMHPAGNNQLGRSSQFDLGVASNRTSGRRGVQASARRQAFNLGSAAARSRQPSLLWLRPEGATAARGSPSRGLQHHPAPEALPQDFEAEFRHRSGSRESPPDTDSAPSSHEHPEPQESESESPNFHRRYQAAVASTMHLELQWGQTEGATPLPRSSPIFNDPAASSPAYNPMSPPYSPAYAPAPGSPQSPTVIPYSPARKSPRSQTPPCFSSAPNSPMSQTPPRFSPGPESPGGQTHPRSESPYSPKSPSYSPISPNSQAMESPRSPFSEDGSHAGCRSPGEGLAQYPSSQPGSPEYSPPSRGHSEEGGRSDCPSPARRGCDGEPGYPLDESPAPGGQVAAWEDPSHPAYPPTSPPYSPASMPYSPTSPPYYPVSPAFDPTRRSDSLSEPPSPKRLGAIHHAARPRRLTSPAPSERPQSPRRERTLSPSSAIAGGSLAEMSEDDEQPRWDRRASRGRSITRRPLTGHSSPSTSPVPMTRRRRLPLAGLSSPSASPPARERLRRDTSRGSPSGISGQQWKCSAGGGGQSGFRPWQSCSTSDTELRALMEQAAGWDEGRNAPSVDKPAGDLLTPPPNRPESPASEVGGKHGMDPDLWTCVDCHGEGHRNDCRSRSPMKSTSRNLSPSVSVELPQPSESHCRAAASTARSASQSPAVPRRHSRTVTPTARGTPSSQGAYGQRTPSPDYHSDSSHPSSRTRTPLPSDSLAAHSGGRSSQRQRSRSRSVARRGRDLFPSWDTSRYVQQYRSGTGLNATNLHPIIAAQMGLPVEQVDGKTAAAEPPTSSASLLPNAQPRGGVPSREVGTPGENGGSAHGRKPTSSTVGLGVSGHTPSGSENLVAALEIEDEEMGIPARRTPSPDRTGTGRRRGRKIPLSFFPSRERSPVAGPSNPHPSPRSGGWNRRKPHKTPNSHKRGLLKHAVRMANMGRSLVNDLTVNLFSDEEGAAAMAAGRATANNDPTTTVGTAGEGNNAGTSSGGSPSVAFVAEKAAPSGGAGGFWAREFEAGRKAMSEAQSIAKGSATGGFAKQREDEEVLDLT